MTASFLDGASRFNDDDVQLFDLVFSRLIGEIETTARIELSRRLAPLGQRAGRSGAPPRAGRRYRGRWSRAQAGGAAVRCRSRRHRGGQGPSASARYLRSGPNRGAGDRRAAAPRRPGRAAQHGRESRRAPVRCGLWHLVERAKTDGVLAEKVLLRPDIAPRLFHDLLLTATDAVQLRLTAPATPENSSEACGAPAKVSNEANAPAAPRDYSHAQRRIEALYQDGKLDAAILVDFAQKTQYDETVAALASLCAVPIEVVDRLMTAERPDPVLILCKSAGWDWSIAKAIIMVRPGGARTSSQNLDAIHADFDRLSPTTAQRVMRFWQARPRHRGRTTDDGGT